MLEEIAPNAFLLRGWATQNDISSNCYFLSSGDGLVLIDCGNASERTSREIKAAEKELGGEIAAAYCTHGHFDHAGGAKTINSKTPVFLSEKDFFLIPNEDNARFKPLKEKKIRFGNFALDVISTPGHSPGSVCFWDEKRRTLYSGDTLFAAGAFGRTDLPGGDEKELFRSLNEIKKLGWRVLCPGHDEVERSERAERGERKH
ncbi:MAG: MBL fold metallo-hydrolase [Candidatus Micrarchaeota archaeon]